MRIIRLKAHHIVFVDDGDYDGLQTYKWYLVVTKKLYTANNHLGLMHRYIMKAPPGMEVHHKDGNGLNNTRSNLQLLTRIEHVHLNSPTGKYKGIREISKGRYDARIYTAGKHKFLGIFPTAEAAARAYDDAARKLWGGDCYLNFG